jgi:hypothetical protein
MSQYDGMGRRGGGGGIKTQKSVLKGGSLGNGVFEDE